MRINNFYLNGLLAASLYTIGVFLGGLLWSNYSHVSQPISELLMDGAPNLSILLPIFTLYNLLLISFSVTIYRHGENRLIKAAGILLFFVGFSGIMMNIFPQDPVNTYLTFPGLMHLVFAGLAAVGSILSIFLGGLGFNRATQDKKFKLLSITLGLIVIVFGGLTPIAISKFPMHFGVFERITIFSFIVWLAIFSYRIYKSET
jgi:hypothetical protein